MYTLIVKVYVAIQGFAYENVTQKPLHLGHFSSLNCYKFVTNADIDLNFPANLTFTRHIFWHKIHI